MTTHTDIYVLCFGVDVWKNLDDEYITIKQFLPQLVSFQMDGQLSRGFEPRLPLPLAKSLRIHIQTHRRPWFNGIPYDNVLSHQHNFCCMPVDVEKRQLVASRFVSPLSLIWTYSHTCIHVHTYIRYFSATTRDVLSSAVAVIQIDTYLWLLLLAVKVKQSEDECET